jgi:prevent-host-death family protein
MGIEEARNDLGGIVDRARLRYEPTRITRQGKPAAVIVPICSACGGTMAVQADGALFPHLRYADGLVPCDGEQS